MKFRVLKKFCHQRPPKSVVRLGLARGDLWWANLDRKPVGPILAQNLTDNALYFCHPFAGLYDLLRQFYEVEEGLAFQIHLLEAQAEHQNTPIFWRFQGHETSNLSCIKLPEGLPCFPSAAQNRLGRKVRRWEQATVGAGKRHLDHFSTRSCQWYLNLARYSSAEPLLILCGQPSGSSQPTHCERRPSCEMVSRILSEKLVSVITVGTLFIIPETSRLRAGKGSSFTSATAMMCRADVVVD